MLDSADLRVFEAVARHGSMSRAAEELHTVQSNVTGRIRQMEARLGQPLFLRNARGVALAPAGQRLLPYATAARRLLEEARRAALDDGTPRGPLVIGSLETTAALRLAPALAGFAAAFPEVDVTIRPGTTCELLEAVLDGAVEGAFVCGPVAHPELVADSVWTEELVLMSAPGRAPDLARARAVVLRLGCSYRQRLEEVLVRRGVPAPRVMEFGTLETILASVAAGLGVTLMPRALVGPVIRPGRVAVETLPGGAGVVETVFVRRRDAHPSSALGALLAHLRAEARPLAAE